MVAGPHGVGGDGGEVRVTRTWLVAVDLLQPEQVGVAEADGAAEALFVEPPVRGRCPVEDVEGRDPHVARSRFCCSGKPVTTRWAIRPRERRADRPGLWSCTAGGTRRGALQVGE